MPILIAAVVLAGALGVLNLLLTLAVIRRLRTLTAPAPPVPPALPDPGTPVGSFTATTTDGTKVSRDFFAAPTLVGVFSTTCAPCHERLPEFADHLAARTPGPALALIVGDREGAQPFLAALDGLATPVVEPSGGPLAEALHVSRYPIFLLVDGAGVIVAAAGAPDRLPTAALS